MFTSHFSLYSTYQKYLRLNNTSSSWKYSLLLVSSTLYTPGPLPLTGLSFLVSTAASSLPPSLFHTDIPWHHCFIGRVLYSFSTHSSLVVPSSLVALSAIYTLSAPKVIPLAEIISLNLIPMYSISYTSELQSDVSLASQD